jgi:heme exporter protein B
MTAFLLRLRGVLEKDVRSELRTRYGITSLLLFVVTSVVLVAFALADEPLPRPMAVGLVWVLMCFSAMSGLGRGFIAEEERGTMLYLRLTTTASAVLFGKLLVNILQSIIANLLAVALLLLFVGTITVGNSALLLLCVLVGSIGLASVVTVISALVARAGTKQAVLPVLSVPLLLPLVLPGTACTLEAFAGYGIAEAGNNLGLMLAYTGCILVVTWLVFDYIWED